MGPNGALSGPDGGAQGTMGGANQPGLRAQDLQGRLIVSEGHRYPLVCLKVLVVDVVSSMNFEVALCC